jgi:hypothetical protein
MQRHHRIAFCLGLLAGGLVALAAHLQGVGGWPLPGVAFLTSFAVTFAAVLWPLVETGSKPSRNRLR